MYPFALRKIACYNTQPSFIANRFKSRFHRFFFAGRFNIDVGEIVHVYGLLFQNQRRRGADEFVVQEESLNAFKARVTTTVSRLHHICEMPAPLEQLLAQSPRVRSQASADIQSYPMYFDLAASEPDGRTKRCRVGTAPLTLAVNPMPCADLCKLTHDEQIRASYPPGSMLAEPAGSFLTTPRSERPKAAEQPSPQQGPQPAATPRQTAN